MILHIGNFSTFIPSFVQFINKNFNDKRHLFCFLGYKENYRVVEQDNLKISKPSLAGTIKHYFLVLKNIHHAEKVILHGLFDVRLILLFSLMPWVLKKCYWIIWGGDLYFHQKPKLRTRDKIKEALRAFVIKRLGYLVTYIPGDLALARKWYNAKGEHKECLMYLSNIFEDKFSNKNYHPRKSVGEDINIIIGNSADPTNNHIEIFEKLVPYKSKKIHIIAPLSYGDKKYAERVISYGRQEFGGKFKPIIDFIPLDDYQQVLKSVDIAVFNHKRQQAMGNTITLLGMGKIVYLRADVTQWTLFKSLGIAVKDISEFDLYPQLNEDDLAHNARIVKSYFNYANLVTQYRRIFSE
ncbi:TDP-N-acetylfucosamine:lipid II N-acetylfucosaminyltransferase [Idiomarina sp.]|uniref:TDP-N-acetylfucosamine:lipid II N-acetylfucosaminyltransferase n=1 Tax=Idiomarina sp. TaxID=1874361 RepID=UPI00258DA293|nr:TDP-N-acetylfucosamine:lipid II N-acetylfucosaminyltransferase [Idiomarina sp.]